VPSTTIRFLAVGHVTNDLLAAGVRPGGSALYAALAAAYQGASGHVLTSHGPDFAGGGLLAGAGVSVTVLPAAHTTAFVNEYRPGGRTQRVTAVATPLAGAKVPPADVVFYCPVAGELSAGCPEAPPGALVGAGLQGWLRDLAPDGTVRPRADLDLSILPRCDAVFLSEEDLPSGGDLLDRLRAAFPLVACTAGAGGARLFFDGGIARVPALSVVEVDPTGAGDVFAATFLLALRAGCSPADAGARAAHAGAIAVTDVGPAALPRLT